MDQGDINEDWHCCHQVLEDHEPKPEYKKKRKPITGAEGEYFKFIQAGARGDVLHGLDEQPPADTSIVIEVKKMTADESTEDSTTTSYFWFGSDDETYYDIEVQVWDKMKVNMHATLTWYKRRCKTHDIELQFRVWVARKAKKGSA